MDKPPADPVPWLPATRSQGALPAVPDPSPSAPPPLAPPPAPGPRFDLRRLTRSPRGAVGLAALAAALLLWPFAELSWIPWLAGLGVLFVLRLLRLDGLLRGWDLPLAGLVVVAGLMLSTGPWSWALAGSIGVLLAGLAQLPWWRLAAVGAVLCVLSGVGYGISSYQERLELARMQVQAGDAARAGIALENDDILPALVRALEQPLPDPQPICTTLGSAAESQLASATDRPTCVEAVSVLHARLPAGTSPTDRKSLPKPRPEPNSASMTIDACATRWAAAAGPELGRIHIMLVSQSQRTYEVERFSRC